MKNVTRPRPASASPPPWASSKSSEKSKVPVRLQSITMPIRKNDVARLGDPEGLHRRARRLGPRVPVADQEVGAEAHQLPADEELDEVGGEHDPHHREREQRLVGVVAAEGGRRLVGEIAERVDLDQEGHEGHQDQHQGGVGVREHAHRGEHAVLHRDPVPEHPARHVRHRRAPRRDRAHQRGQRDHDREPRGRLPGAAKRDDEAQDQEGEAGRQPGPEREVAGDGHESSAIP